MTSQPWRLANIVQYCTSVLFSQSWYLKELSRDLLVCLIWAFRVRIRTDNQVTVGQVRVAGERSAQWSLADLSEAQISPSAVSRELWIVDNEKVVRRWYGEYRWSNWPRLVGTLFAPPFTSDFLGNVCLNLALGLVTSCFSHQATWWKPVSCWARVQEHWWPQYKPLGWEWGYKNIRHCSNYNWTMSMNLIIICLKNLLGRFLYFCAIVWIFVPFISAPKTQKPCFLRFSSVRFKCDTYDLKLSKDW